MNQDHQEQAKLQQQILMLENNAKRLMTAEAVARYGNVKAAHPEKAVQLTALITQLAQQGQVKGLISDDQLKELLMHMEPKKRETRITRK